MHNKKYRCIIAAGLSFFLILSTGITANASTEYVVKKGDTLWKIAKTYLGSGTLFGKIFDANRDVIKNPDRIQIGWKITIPGKEESKPTQIVNPVRTYDSLDAMNEAAGTMLMHPGVMGVTNERFAVITGDNKMAEYSYEVAGISYTLRCCPTALEDISGVYINGKLAFEGRPAPDDIDFIFTDGCYLARWFRVEGQFVLSAKPAKGYTQDAFKAVAEETKMLNAIQQEADGEDEVPVEYFDPYALVGDYGDRVSQRASMNIEYNEDAEEYKVVIMWGNSASETMQWTMTAYDYGNTTSLNYGNCVCKTLTYDSSGKETQKVVYENKEGTLDINEDMTITWIDDNSKEHIFERIN